ncbi:glycerate kinase type-2 family protein [Paraburkholderia caledonica]|uniref:glycerate kinase type-2 family protein n=1 Tax=Paraburkholderia caledonica TaxID=134536 RepID=UPI001FCA2220|nr:glycerate kinase [Paraburkholderia caledonica]
MFKAAIATAQPALRVPHFLPKPPHGRTIVIGAGKASAAMAQAVEKHWTGPLEGLVVTRYGYAVPCDQIEIVEAAHPVPDLNGLQAAQRMLEFVSGLTADDLVICLISGGGSSLLPLPAEGLTLQDKQEINQALLASGATIAEMNCVRRHLSAIKGGRLAAACHPARVVNLIISDVPADAARDIASGPTVPDTTTCSDALAVLRRYEICASPAAIALLESGSTETLKPDDPRLPQIETHLIATPQLALEAAAKKSRAAGIDVHILGDAIEGEARDVGAVMAGIARQVNRRGQPFQAPCILLSGGETTVTIRGEGRGGRNVEFLLSLGLALNGEPGVFAIAGDTDGVDGQEEIAGALLRPDTLKRARESGIRPTERLQNNDAHGFFQALGDSVITGPTLTNVNDFRAIFIAAQHDNLSGSLKDAPQP